mgnify:CR=1 FL=1
MSMKYDFTTILNREGTGAIAVSKIPFDNAEIKEGFSKIPMWVADMNYATAPSVIEAIQNRLAHPVFGYFDIKDAYSESIIEWQKTRNGVTDIPKEAIDYENGVLGGVSSVLQAFTAPGEAILLHSPAYIGFIGTITNMGRKIVYSPLKKDEQGVWRMDYEDMDKKLKENHIHLAIFCSPHNPSGRVWEREEIEAAMEVYRKNDCIVISDEIWSDLTLGNRQHIPTQTVSEDAKTRTIAMYAPTKTFNLAGLIGSYHIVYNPYLRDRMNKQTSLSHYNNMNIFSMHGLIGAYSKDGQEWADELKAVLTENMEWAYDFITKNWDGVELAKPEGTYMLYLDCHKWCEAHHKTMDELLQAGVKVGVIWQDGRAFFYPDSIRMNLALPFSRVQEAFHRLDKYVFRAEA